MAESRQADSRQGDLFESPSPYGDKLPLRPVSSAVAGRLPTTEEARVRRDVGMSTVEDNAKPTWQEEVRVIIWEFPPGTKFMGEDVHERLDQRGFEVHDRRALGPAIISAAKAGLIRRIGYAPARTSNLSPKVLWERT